MMWSSIGTWISTNSYQISMVGRGIVVVACCIGGYLLMDQIRKEGEEYVIMKRNSKGQFQKADKPASVSFEKNSKNDAAKKMASAASVAKAPAAVKPEREIKHSPAPVVPEKEVEEVKREPVPMPEKVIRRSNTVLVSNSERTEDLKSPVQIQSRSSNFIGTQEPSRYVPTPVHTGITNGDRIRSMTDEELAEFIADVENGGLKAVKFLRLWLQQDQRK